MHKQHTVCLKNWCLKNWTTNFNTNSPLCRAQIVGKQKQHVVTSTTQIHSIILSETEIERRWIEIDAIRRNLWD
jgi:hypothetical protein